MRDHSNWRACFLFQSRGKTVQTMAGSGFLDKKNKGNKARLWPSFLRHTLLDFSNLPFIRQPGLLIGVRWHSSTENLCKFVLTHILCPTPVGCCKKNQKVSSFYSERTLFQNSIHLHSSVYQIAYKLYKKLADFKMLLGNLCACLW